MSIQNVFKSLTRWPTRVSALQDLRRPARRRSPAIRLCLEPLEDRCLLSTLVVNSPLDVTLAGDGMVTLREAIVAANDDTATDLGQTGSGADTIVFDESMRGQTIQLVNGELAITSDLVIQGLGASDLTVSVIEGLAVPTSRVFRVDDGTDTVRQVGISGLTITGGRTTWPGGGGIYNREQLTLDNCTVSRNSGGGIYNLGTATLTLNNSTVSANLPGQIMNTDNATVTLNNSTVSGDGTNILSEGIHNTLSGTVILNNSTVSGNYSNETGGGIYNADFGAVTLNSSTVSGNKAAYGGGIYNAMSATLTLNNSTVSDNDALYYGGAIYIADTATATLNNSTVSGNNTGHYYGGGIVVDGTFNPDTGWSGGGTLTLRSTIVANSTDSAGTQNDLSLGLGTINAYHSLIENVNGFPINGTNKFNLIGVDPMLGALADNGGPTQTHALLAGSPAINNGSNPLRLPYDQRGPGFARVVDRKADIGAFEVQPASSPAASSASSADADLLAAANSETRFLGETGFLEAATTEPAISDPITAPVDAFFATGDLDDPVFAFDGLKEDYLDPITGAWLNDAALIPALI